MDQSEVFKDHRVAELRGINTPEVLVDEDLLLLKAKSLAERLKLTVVGEFVHKFEPREEESTGGLSLILAISESHIAIHTWEAKDYMHIDAFSCSPYTNMRNFRREVLSEFPTKNLKTRKINYA